MCGRYFLDAGEEPELAEVIRELQRRGPEDAETKLYGEVFPGDTAPVLCLSRSLKRGYFAMRWGYTLPDGRRVINARSESAAEKPLFSDGMAQRRCLIPLTGYYEWERTGGGKRRHFIRPAERGGVRMAGIYRLEAGRPVYTVLTRAAAPEIAFIHDRMPVLLPAQAAEAWLNPEIPADGILKSALLSMQYE